RVTTLRPSRSRFAACSAAAVMLGIIHQLVRGASGRRRRSATPGAARARPHARVDVRPALRIPGGRGIEPRSAATG
ncbi:MAG TPA: hypothetical protein VHB47_11815, partial [Thermoanaerobaculia bacterium]|nr:hypothetical protein [Thermoanaerobaculia bacterium]